MTPCRGCGDRPRRDARLLPVRELPRRGTPTRFCGPKTVTVLTGTHRDRHVREAVRQAEIVAQEVCRARDPSTPHRPRCTPKNSRRRRWQPLPDLMSRHRCLMNEASNVESSGGILAVGQGIRQFAEARSSRVPPGTQQNSRSARRQGITFRFRRIVAEAANRHGNHEVRHGWAAAVIAATAAIARLGLPASVTTYAACAENMPSGTAQRPGDVLTTYGGRTVEVLNTDAEGRLVLADALVRAGRRTRRHHRRRDPDRRPDGRPRKPDFGSDG